MEKPGGKKRNPLDKPMTRRDFLKFSGGIAGLAAAGAILKDRSQYIEEREAEHIIPREFYEAVDLMDTLDVRLPNDSLYGFSFPSTKEVAAKYRAALMPASGKLPELWVKHEKEAKSLIGRLFPGERVDVPTVSSIGDPEYPPSLTFPSHMQHFDHVRRVVAIYHEGLHLFYDPPVFTYEEKIASEVHANIADVLLAREMAQRLPRPYMISEIDKAYSEAVEKNDKTTWENYIRVQYPDEPTK